jgi:hypothetical protein
VLLLLLMLLLKLLLMLLLLLLMSLSLLSLSLATYTARHFPSSRRSEITSAPSRIHLGSQPNLPKSIVCCYRTVNAAVVAAGTAWCAVG